MNVFLDYAYYYDLLYADKPYAEESIFVLDILEEYGAYPNSILDLGCGSGKHDAVFANKGIRVTGIDVSTAMLEAGKKEYNLVEQAELLEFLQADARTARLKRKFSAVVSLFHVLSYQTTEEDALAFFRTAAAHLEIGGLLFADFWYGPGVLTMRPEVREKMLDNETMRIVRKAVPTLYSTKNLVNVHYDIHVLLKKNGKRRNFAEDHRMRYWFLPELAYLAGEGGFEPVAQGAWFRTEEPTTDDWAAWLVCRKRVDR